MMEDRLKAWVQKTIEDNKSKKQKVVDTGFLPDSILFYRDGVSESQYGMVLHEEKPQILQSCKNILKFYKNTTPAMLLATAKWTPKLTLVVVTKRHHARFYPQKAFQKGRMKKTTKIQSVEWSSIVR